MFPFTLCLLLKNGNLSCPSTVMVVHLFTKKRSFNRRRELRKGAESSSCLLIGLTVFFVCIIRTELQNWNKYNASGRNLSTFFYISKHV